MNGIKRTVLAAFATVLMVLGAGVTQANAVGGGCRLSANWWATTSANWNGTTHTYAVITSPGALRVGLSDTYDQGWNGGTFVNTRAFYRVGTSTNPYTYRANFDQGPVTRVDLKVEAPSGIYCISTIYR